MTKAIPTKETDKVKWLACAVCGKEKFYYLSKINASMSKQPFCSISCGTIYANKYTKIKEEVTPKSCINCSATIPMEHKEGRFSVKTYNLKQFCCQRCHYDWMAKQRKVLFTCERCGVSFEVTEYTKKKRKFCSTKCSAAVKGERDKEAALKRRIELCCDECGKTFLRHPCKVKLGKNYCSKSCSAKNVVHPLAERITFKCSLCNKGVTRLKSGEKFLEKYNKYGDRFCSISCRTKFWKNIRNPVEKVLGLTCSLCNSDLPARSKNHVGKNKNNLFFCNKNCYMEYVSIFKPKWLGGARKATRRSKIELEVEEFLKSNLKEISIEFNNRTKLNGLEIDIFLPDFSFGIELDGIFHFQPILGEEIFSKTQERHIRKVNLCDLLGLEIIYLDITKVTRKKDERIKLCEEVLSIIKDRLAREEDNSQGTCIIGKTTPLKELAITL
jgi:hypothetical protein